MIGLRYLNSEAYSTSTGIRAHSSKIYSATKPACQEVPQATIMMRSALTNFLRWSSRPLSLIKPSSGSKRPRNVSRIACGCSCISLSIKCSYPPFSICSKFMVSLWITGAIDWSLFNSRKRGARPKRKIAISLSSRYMAFLVNSKKGVASLAMKYSLSPIPIASGLPSFATTISSGFWMSNTAMA